MYILYHIVTSIATDICKLIFTFVVFARSYVRDNELSDLRPFLCLQHLKSLPSKPLDKLLK